MWAEEGLCRGAAAKSLVGEKGPRSRLHNGSKAPEALTASSLLSRTPVPQPANTAFFSGFNDLQLPNNALKLHIMPFWGPSPTGRVLSPASSLTISCHSMPPPPSLTYYVLDTCSAPEVTCHMGLWAREMWLVWTQVCCKYKIHTGFWRLCKKNGK